MQFLTGSQVFTLNKVKYLSVSSLDKLELQLYVNMLFRLFKIMSIG